MVDTRCDYLVSGMEISFGSVEPPAVTARPANLIGVIYEIRDDLLRREPLPGGSGCSASS
jgi:hypothetical protein